jgi:autotransporter adhesin
VALGSRSVADQEDTVSVGKAGSERRITNVAGGQASTDAVNYGQVKKVTEMTEAKISELEAKLEETRRYAAREIAAMRSACSMAIRQWNSASLTSSQTMSPFNVGSSVPFDGGESSFR